MRSENVFEASSVVKTVTDTIADGIAAKDRFTSSPGIARSSSLTKATSGLNIVFPVLVTKSSNFDTAMMVSRAVERKAVSLLQIAFSAFDITNAKDATDFIKNFHTNLKGKISLDDFIDAMDTYANENGLIVQEKAGMYDAVIRDLRSISTYYPDDTSESPLSRFMVSESSYGTRVFTEKKSYVRSDKSKQREVDDYRFQHQKEREEDQDRIRYKEREEDQEYREKRDKVKDRMDGRRLAAQIRNNKETQKTQRDRLDYEKERDIKSDEYKRERDKVQDKKDREKAQRDKERDARQAARDDIQNQKDIQQMFTTQIFSSDIKKANELVPTMMVVNFVTIDGEHQINRQVVIGVKAKLFPVDSQDVINKIIVKNADRNILLKFIKASTKEISFLKDFLFAIDNAKLSAIANSKNGSSTNKLLKTLERRALNGKIRKAFKINNAYKAIATLVITKEEADYIYKNNNIDVTNARVMRPIMENLSLMMFIIVDDSNEVASILMDSGDDNFESISYTHLEREASDNSSKKIINLMTKLNR